MRRRFGSVLQFAAPIRVMAQRFAFALFVAMAIAILVLFRGETITTERLRTAVLDVVTPVYVVLSQPVDAVARLTDEVRALVALRNENVRLREENARLIRWRDEVSRLKAENEQLRDLLAFVPDPPVRFMTARVVADTGSVFVRSLLVSAGSEAGVAKGQAVLGNAGLVGRVIEAGRNSARILLLTDINSRVPVLIEGSQTRGILAGDNGPRPRIVFIAEQSQLAVGDRVVTSGHGGSLPAGLPVGEVASIEDGSIRVQLFVRGSEVEYVRIADFALSQAAAGDKRAGQNP